MFCHVRHAAGDALRFRCCISRLPRRFVPIRSVLPTAAPAAANIADGGVGAARRQPSAAGPCFARIACAPRRALAPARFVRLIARARRRTHFSRRLPPGFFGPSRFPAQKSERRPRKPPLCCYCSTFSSGQELWRIYLNILDQTEIIFDFPAPAAGRLDPIPPRASQARPRPLRRGRGAARRPRGCGGRAAGRRRVPAGRRRRI